jgi:hypothetical protein
MPTTMRPHPMVDWTAFVVVSLAAAAAYDATIMNAPTV